MKRPLRNLFVGLMVFTFFLQQSPLYAVDSSMLLSEDKKISIDYKNADLNDVLKAMSYSYNINIVVSKDVTGKVSAQLKGVTIDEALNAVLSVNNYSFIHKDNIIYVMEKTKMDAVTETLPLHFISIKQAKSLLSGALLKSDAIIQENEDVNTLVVTTNPSELAKIKEFLKNIDLPPIQVLIEAQIVDINKSDIQQIDSAISLIYTGANVGGGFSKFSPSTSVGSSTTSSSSSSSSSSGADNGSFTFNNKNNYQLSINALVNQHKARVIASPSIATLNGHEASIIIGEKYPYINSTSSSGVGGVVNQTTTSFVDIGTKLKVTPKVSPDGWITMRISPEVSSVLSVVNGNPDIATRQAETEVRVRDNETIVIGGLKSKSDLRDRNGIPFLKDIPILGALFQNHNTTLVDGELTVLITPHIIPMPKVVGSNIRSNIYAPSTNTGDVKLLGNILSYADSLDADRAKAKGKNLYLSEELIQTYRMILQEFPHSGKSDYCLYKIALIYAKDFINCNAAKEALTEMQDVSSKSPYVSVTESLVDACAAVHSRPKKNF